MSAARRVTMRWSTTETHEHTFDLLPGEGLPDEDDLAEHENVGTFTGTERTIDDTEEHQ